MFPSTWNNKKRGGSFTKLDCQLGADAGLLDLLDLELDQGVVVLDPWHVLAQEVSMIVQPFKENGVCELPIPMDMIERSKLKQRVPMSGPCCFSSALQDITWVLELDSNILDVCPHST